MTLNQKISKWKPRFFDIGVNFSDKMFQGFYNGSDRPKHPPDIQSVITRARQFNVNKMLITSSNLKESGDHVQFCMDYPNEFYSTVGVHPCTVAEEFYVRDSQRGKYTEDLVPELAEKLESLRDLVVNGVKMGSVKAFGEVGLDYDRLHYSSVNQQREMFHKQLEVVASLKDLKLPLFLHMRSACDDFIKIIKPFIDNGDIIRGNGVVHSFTGSEEELFKLLELGFYIGINGCSLKTDENLRVAKLIPLDKLLIETDAPWCEIRKSHASYKYLTQYPNIFYPELALASKKIGIDDNNIVVKKAQKPNAIKLDSFLPFPSIKKENYEKHLLAVENLRNNSEYDIDTSMGDFSSPLFKSRNEPVFVGQIAQIICALHGIVNESEIQNFIDQIYNNSTKLFRVD